VSKCWSNTLVGIVTRYYFLSECYCLNFAVLFLWGALSDERTGLQFFFSAITQWSKSLKTRNHTLFSHLRLLQPAGPVSAIYVPQGMEWTSYTPGHRVCPKFGGRSYFTTDSQSVCLGTKHPCGTCDQILLPVGMLLSEICGLVSVGRPL
jgi:hypothetical protein